MQDDRELQLKKELLIKSCLEKGDPSLFLGFDKSVGNEVLTRREQGALLKLCHSGGDEFEFNYSELDNLGLELLSMGDVHGIADQVAAYRSQEKKDESEDVIVIIKKIIAEEIKRKRSLLMDYHFNSLYTKRKLVRKYVEKGEIHCFYCDHQFSQNMEGYNFMSVDHKIPQKIINDIDPALYNSIDNLVLCCKPCNSSKGSKPFFEYRNGKIFENTKKLEEFKEMRKEDYKFSDLYAHKTLFCALKAEEDWVNDPEKYRNEIINELEKNPDISKINTNIKDGFNFSYKGKDDFSYWDLYCAFYIRKKKYFESHEEALKKRGYSIIWRKFFDLADPKEIAQNIIEEAEFCVNLDITKKIA